MRRSSGDQPPSNSNDFDFGWGYGMSQGSVSPLPQRHHTISAGTSANGKVLRTVDWDAIQPPRPPKLPIASPDTTAPIAAMTYHSRRPPSNGSFIIRKQDSIAEEPSPSGLFENDNEHFTWSRSPSPIRFPAGSGFDSPDGRKLSLSPAANTNSLYNNVFARRKKFQREISSAHSEVTETVVRKQMTDAATSPIPPAYSCENNLQIRFDISSGSSLAKSTSSSFGRTHSQRHKKTSLACHGGSLVANGFLPATFLTVESKPRLERDPTKWHLSILKQRSSSESAFQPSSIPRTMIDSGLQVRRCSVAMLNPAKENALLRKILGPSGLSWLSETPKQPKSGLTFTKWRNKK